jgi:hypothetical protein
MCAAKICIYNKEFRTTYMLQRRMKGWQVNNEL